MISMKGVVCVFLLFVCSEVLSVPHPPGSIFNLEGLMNIIREELELPLYYDRDKEFLLALNKFRFL